MANELKWSTVGTNSAITKYVEKISRLFEKAGLERPAH